MVTQKIPDRVLSGLFLSTRLFPALKYRGKILFERISRRPAIAQSQHMIVCWVTLGPVFAKSHRQSG
ncbi:hypothetical protein LIP41_08185, partial [Bifidobacterium animalis]|nr:hypothetical protein [Bifidobacterium animalis]